MAVVEDTERGDEAEPEDAEHAEPDHDNAGDDEARRFLTVVEGCHVLQWAETGLLGSAFQSRDHV